jgi:hypothetical protein
MTFTAGPIRSGSILFELIHLPDFHSVTGTTILSLRVASSMEAFSTTIRSKMAATGLTLQPTPPKEALFTSPGTVGPI